MNEPRSSRPHPSMVWLNRYARLTPGWSDLYGTEPTWDEFFKRLHQFERDEVLYFLSHVNAVLSRHDDVQGQLGLCHDLFQPDHEDVAERYKRFAIEIAREGAQEPPHLFYPAQVLMTAKIAIANPPGRLEQNAGSLRPLGEALLMLTDLVRDSGPSDVADILVGMTAAHLFNASEVPVHALGRSFELYMSDHHQLHGHDSYLDLPAELERITGLKPTMLWLMLLTAFGKLSTRPAQECGLPFNLDDYLLAPGENEGPAFTQEEVQRVAKLLVATIPEVAEEIVQSGFSYTTARLHDLAEFAVHPIIRHEGKDLCMSDDLLFRKLTGGVHHFFLNREQMSKAKRDRYLRFTGAMFERYADSVLSRCLQSQGGHYSGLLPNRNTTCCDAVWRCGDALVLFELKAGQFSRDARAGNRERLVPKLHDLVFEPSRQIDSTINLFKSGRLPEAGEEPQQVRRFFPLALTLEALSMEAAMHERLVGAISSLGFLRQEGVRPLQLMNVAELEYLELGLDRGLKLLHILAKKLDVDEWRGASFKSFFLFQYSEYFKGQKNAHLRRVFDRVRDEAIAVLRDRLGRASLE